MAVKRIERKDLVAPDAITSVIDETVKLEAQLTKVVNINQELLKTNPLKSSEDIKNFNKDIQSTVKSTESLAKVTKQLNSQTDEEIRGRIRLQRAQKQQRDTLRDLVVLEDKEAGTLEKLNARNRQLRRERAALIEGSKDYEKNLKRINSELDSNNKKIKDNSDQLKKQRLNVGNYTESIKDAAQNIEIFGTNVGTLGDQFLSFARNPLGAVTAGLSALSALYASSTSGARDLRSAQIRLTTTFTGFGESLAKLVGADGKGGGLFDSFTRIFTQGIFGATTAAEGDIASFASNELEQLRVAQAESDRLARQQLLRTEQLRNIRDDEARSLQERIEANEQLLTVINSREEQQVEVLEKRLKATEILLSLDKENVDLQVEVIRLQEEIADKQEENEGFRAEQLANVNSLRREGAALDKERLKDQEKINAELEKQKKIQEAIDNIAPIESKKAETTETEKQAKAQGELATNLSQTDDAYQMLDQRYQSQIDKERILREERQQTVSEIVESAQFIGDALDRASEKRLRFIDDELEQTQRAADRQAQLAVQGLNNTLAFEDKKAAELERKREQEAEKQERRQKVLAYLAQFTELSKTDANSAAVKAAANVAIAEAVSALFYDGTEKVEDDIAGKPFFAGKDGYLIRVDGSERIMTGDQNRRIGNISNDDLANIAEMYNKGQLINYAMNDKNIVKELQELRKGQSQVSLEIDKQGIVTQQQLKSGLKKISRKYPKRI